MASTGEKTSQSEGEGTEKPVAPAIALPKGGGAVRGIGEKFAANPVTGTGSMSVPIATSPGRTGFGPHLSLSYDSGSGNGPFGFGWNLPVPSITRKTDKRLPQYLDRIDGAVETDVFMLPGSEDLVAVLDADGSRLEDLTTAAGYVIHRYRPRIEGLFARIERWTHASDGDVHWRSISRDNVLTLYGRTPESRIADSADPLRIFTWLICETRDDKGNGVLYGYKPEDGSGVDLTRACERNRGDRDDPRRKTNRYLKRIRYGNRTPLLDDAGERPRFLDDLPAQVRDTPWMFEVIFDYGEHASDNPASDDAGPWTYRRDPFSSYRAGFEVRITRLCQRVLMFHHIPDLPGGEKGYDGLVRSTDLTYSPTDDPGTAGNAVYTFLREVTQTGYRRSATGYDKRSLPPVTFQYSEAIVQDVVGEVDPASLENLPIGVDGTLYRWTDLHGEGIPGILTEQDGGWFYKRNISPISARQVEFGPLECVIAKPNLILAGGRAEFMDLAGDGLPDLVMLDGPTPGFYEHDDDESWQPFRPFSSRLNRDLHDPNLRLVDLDGDGHADVLITEDHAFVWHPSLAEEGFGAARRMVQPLDDEKGPRLVFADGTQSIYLADVSGDGLTDLVRVRNKQISYWPNLGYGRFGDKVTMDDGPTFDNEEEFDQKRIRLADIDGSGTADLIYLHRDGVRLYFNRSGNAWSAPQNLRSFPRVDDLVSVVPTDLFGNGTACLVWSSPLPGDARLQMRYLDLMGGQKPHLLVKTANNLGAETRVEYASSTRFYLRDKYDGKPWIFRLPFPVHVVERVETYDHISRNRFVTRYAFHHGYYDGEDREFRGFGMVEQYDTEELAALTSEGALVPATNADVAFNVPPVVTKTWFHVGAYLGREHISDFFAGLLDTADKGEYYREPGLTDEQARAMLLPDTLLPRDLTLHEEREACRALKGSMLRQEVYALDGTDKEEHPYTVVEQSFGIQLVQALGTNPHAVFLTHAREAISYHYERSFVLDPTDPEPDPLRKRKLLYPRITHALTLEVDPFGNVLKEVAIGYGRTDSPLLLQADREKQTRTLVTYTENRVTNPVDDPFRFPDAYRVPMPCETSNFELTGYAPGEGGGRFRSEDFVVSAGDAVTAIFDTEVRYEDPPTGGSQRRLIEQVRTLYRSDDLSALLTLGQVEPLALPGENYKLAFTPGLLTKIFQRSGQPLLPDPAAVLEQAADGGGYVRSQRLKADGRFPDSDGDDHWWIPSGRLFLSPDGNDTSGAERAYARYHYFLPVRSRDPFHSDTMSTESFVIYDGYDLLMSETRDALDNRVTAGERLPGGSRDVSKAGNDYRVLQPSRVMDPNRNRTDVAFDILGLVAGTAVMGKPLPAPVEGDSLEAFQPDLTEAQIAALFDAQDPLLPAAAFLAGATTRIVYDFDRFQRTRSDHPDDPERWLPACSATLARETHLSEPLPAAALRAQISFSYSDGFGREIQKKVRAEPGPVPRRDGSGRILVGSDGSPDMTPQKVSPRWVGSGWTIFNNKGKPVRQFEPFFTDRHEFEFDTRIGVSPVLFYDPLQRVVATLHPAHTYDKVVFDPWAQVTSDVNDTVRGDPRTDGDIRGYTAGYFRSLLASPPERPWQTWYEERQGTALGPEEEAAANKAAAHADTPTTAHFDTLGRTFLSLSDNGPDPAHPDRHLLFATRVELDIEGNRRVVRDAIVQSGDEEGRIVMRYSYDMLGNQVYGASMEAGERWMLNDVAGKAIRAWDSRGHSFRTEYDPLRRRLRSFVTGADPSNPNSELLTERMVYGEQHPQRDERNLRGRLYLHLDQAGSVTAEAHDFKGNLLRASRRLTSGTQYRQTVDWRGVDAGSGALPTDSGTAFSTAALESALAPSLELDTYTSLTSWDALNRPVAVTTPHTTTMVPNVIRPGYNEANLLDRLDANLRGAADSTAFVINIDYDAKGRRQRIDYGNGVSTLYEYDLLTFRLIHLLTVRNAVIFPDDCPRPSPAGWPGCQAQNLHYSYDPVGNITHISDDAQQTIFFRNKRVEPSSDYTCDALYRLIKATGREHLGQIGGAPIPHSWNDGPRVGIEWSANDGNAMGTYTERYVYDAVGNFVTMQHRGDDPANPGWTRAYTYNETSLIEGGSGGTLVKSSNRLSSTTVGGNDPPVERYSYDSHGNMTRMPHLGSGSPADNMRWDYRDELSQADLGGGGTAYYVYDASGQRVRKICEKPGGLIEERIYFGGFEIYRKRQGMDRFERETLHVMGDKQRIALVETRTLDTAQNDTAPQQVVRFQLANHIESCSLELNDQAEVISYEEYTPYGSTAYQAVRSQTETPKRYRYTGKERDEESGLCYHGARYYAPWLGRWTSCDPAGVCASPNLFVYVSDRPLILVDPTGRDDEPGWFSRHVGPASPLGQYISHADYPGSSVLQDDKKLQTAQAFAEGVAVGAAVTVVVVVAAPVVIAAAAAEVSTVAGGVALAATGSTVTAAAVTTTVAAGTTSLAEGGLVAYGAYQTAKTVTEVSTKRDLDTGRPLTDPEVANRVGGLAVGVLAMGHGLIEPRPSTGGVKSAVPEEIPATSSAPESPPVKSPSAKSGSSRWKVGDPIDAPVKGKEPSWSAVRQRYWKTRATTATPEEFGDPDLARMAKGRAPIDPYSGKPMELEHVIPQRTNAPGRHASIMEVTPLEHAFFDPYRLGVTDTAGQSWQWSYLDTR